MTSARLKSALSRSVILVLLLSLYGCTGHKTAPGSAAASRNVSFPSVAHNGRISGQIFLPDFRRYHGKRPTVVVQSDQAWAAAALATRGYIGITVGISLTAGFDRAIDVARSAVAYVRSGADAARARIDRSRIGLVAWSVGSGVMAVVQREGHGVGAMVVLDDLVNGVPSHDGLPGRQPVVPKVPALAVASEDEYGAGGRSRVDRKPGFHLWRARKKPTMEVVLAGFQHSTFASGSPAQLREVEHFMRAWFDRYLGAKRAATQRSATRRLLAPTVSGSPLGALLSHDARSAAFLPGRLDCEDLRTCLGRRP